MREKILYNLVLVGKVTYDFSSTRRNRRKRLKDVRNNYEYSAGHLRTEGAIKNICDNVTSIWDYRPLPVGSPFLCSSSYFTPPPVPSVIFSVYVTTSSNYESSSFSPQRSLTGGSFANGPFNTRKYTTAQPKSD